jgi:RimJ/RimL family protein N-acetyltransferase
MRRFLWDDREIERSEAAATLSDCLALSSEGLGLWLLLLSREDGEENVNANPIGCAGLLPVTTAAEYEPRLAGSIEPLVALYPSMWGRGYASEALQALQIYAAGTLGLKSLAGVTDLPNVKSDRLLRRAGFEVIAETDGPRYPLRIYLWEADRP